MGYIVICPGPCHVIPPPRRVRTTSIYILLGNPYEVSRLPSVYTGGSCYTNSITSHNNGSDVYLRSTPICLLILA